MRKPSPAMIVALAALFVALGGVGVAATDGTFILGQSNTASTNTALSAPIAGGKTLQLTNNDTSNAASTALGLNVASGHAPFTVNTGIKVAGLNSDKLDGFDSSYFLPKNGTVADSAKLGGQLPSKYLQYVWSSFSYPGFATPQNDGHVAKFNFGAPVAGFALVTAQFQVRVKNNGTNDCHLESQLATAPAVIGTVQPGNGSAGFVDDWVNSNLPTQDTAGNTYLGLNMSVSRVFPVVAGSNTVYLNGQYNNYGVGQANCSDALWGPISMSAVFANQNPNSTLTAP